MAGRQFFVSPGVKSVAKSIPTVRSFQSGESPIFEYPYAITGITKDGTGTPVAGATVQLVRTQDNSPVHSTVSDANGAYTIAASQVLQHYLRAKNSAGTLVGTTVDTLVGT
jgi:hypothetical protein